MSIDTSVKFFHSGMTGAPQLTATAGSLLTILRACLVSGFGAVAVDSIAVASGVATLTISAGMPFSEVDSVILVSGCTLAALNGEKKISATGTTTLSFDAAGLADGSYSGGISAKIAPAGWAELFTGTNVAVFQSLDPKSTKCCLRVDDTGANDARIVGYEAMSDINTGIGQTPLSSQISGGLYWAKARADSDSAKPHTWIVVADSRAVYFGVMPYLYYRVYCVYSFGDLAETKENDPFAWVILGSVNPDAGLNGGAGRISQGGSQGIYMPRNDSGSGVSTNIYRQTAFGGKSGQYAFGDHYASLDYPSARNNSLSVAPLVCFGGSVIGSFPGLQSAICKCEGMIPFLSATTLNGRKHIGIPTASGADNPSGASFFDVTGPWR